MIHANDRTFSIFKNFSNQSLSRDKEEFAVGANSLLILNFARKGRDNCGLLRDTVYVCTIAPTIQLSSKVNVPYQYH